MMPCSASTWIRNTTPAIPTSSGCPSRRWMWTGSAKHANPDRDYGGRGATCLRTLALLPLRRFPGEETPERRRPGILRALLLQPFGATGDSYGGGDFLPRTGRSLGIGERGRDVERDTLGGIPRGADGLHLNRLLLSRNGWRLCRIRRLLPHWPLCGLQVRRGVCGADLRQDTGDPHLVLLATGFAVRRDGCIHVQNAHHRMRGADCGALDLNGDRSRECRRSPAESV